MALQVTTHNEVNPVQIFTDAIKWHIDDNGNLHIIDAEHKHLAAYKHSVWASVNHLLTENQAAAEDAILDEIHNAIDAAGINDEEHPDFALNLLGGILTRLIEAGHLPA